MSKKQTNLNENSEEHIDPSSLAQNTKITEDESQETSLTTLITSLFAAYDENGNDHLKREASLHISNFLNQEASKFNCSSKYNILILFDSTSLIRSDADQIYNSVTGFDENKPLLLIIYSTGGSAGSAYLIGKLCREYSNGKFIVTIPRHAKSAATLICCAANEIHMGSMSELGPIDPQINGLPALGLKNSVEHIAELVKVHPSSSDMFAKYLNFSLELINLGYYERVAESALQYAERLLETHKENLASSPKEIAYELVYKYKDHGFVIDKAEAESIFGNNVVKKNTEEYELGNTIYKALNLITNVVDVVGYNFHFIGSLKDIGTFTKRKKSKT